MTFTATPPMGAAGMAGGNSLLPGHRTPWLHPGGGAERTPTCAVLSATLAAVFQTS